MGKEGNRIAIHDPQNGRSGAATRKYSEEHTENRDGRMLRCPAIKPGSFAVTRIDDCDPVDECLDVLGGELDQWQ